MASIKEQPLDKSVHPVVNSADEEVQGGQYVEVDTEDPNAQYDYDSERSPFAEGLWCFPSACAISLAFFSG